MTFINGWALGLGAAAAALPLVIHLLTRPKPAPMPLSTIRFVRLALRQRQTRHRLRDGLVLLLRTAAVLLLALAIARPTQEGDLAAAAAEADVQRVVIVDVSQSMGQVSGGVQLFERARSLAAGYLSDRPRSSANLVLAGASARPVFDRLSTNFGALRGELQRARPRPERLNVAAAINQAAELLSRAGEGAGQLELVIISDFQRANWAKVDFAPLPEACRIQLESLAPQEPQANVAVLAAALRGRVEQGRAVRLDVDVGNFSAAARQVEVQAAVGDEIIRWQGLCGPGVKTTLSTELTPKQTGWQAGEVRVLDIADALSEDNARSVAFEVRPAPTYLLVTRQPAEVRPSSSYYLERAIVPAIPRESASAADRVQRVDPEKLDREGLAAADVVVAVHPGKLTEEAIRLLAAYVRRGRGLLYVAGEVIDATNLKLLADAAGSDWQMPVELHPAAARSPKGGLFLSEVRQQAPPFGIFGDSLPSLVSSLRFTAALGSRRLATGLVDDVVAAYGDRSACLVISPCGSGSVAVLNADLARSNLVQSPVFVPLVAELLGRLSAERQREGSFVCGEPFAAYLPGRAGPASGLTVRHRPLLAHGAVGAEELTELQLAEDSGGVVLRSAAAPPPGLCAIERGGTVVCAIATGIAEEEADLRSLDADVLTTRLAGGRTVQFRSSLAEDQPQDRTWVILAVACACCMLAEWIVLRVFRT